MQEQTVQEQLAQELAAEMEGKYLSFFIDRQLYGIAIAEVVQIISMQAVTQMPEFPHYAKGVINLRGTIIPVIDMRLRLGKEEREYDEKTCIIVTLIAAMPVGFIVDAVDAVMSIDKEKISMPPRLGDGSANVYLTGIARLEDKVALLMDVSKILSDEALTCISLE